MNHVCPELSLLVKKDLSSVNLPNNPLSVETIQLLTQFVCESLVKKSDSNLADFLDQFKGKIK